MRRRALSPRQVEILEWAFIGKENSEIAAILGIERCTVKNHLQIIYQRLNAYNRQNAIYLALRAGIIGPPDIQLPPPPPPPPLVLPNHVDDWVCVGNLQISHTIGSALVAGKFLLVQSRSAFAILLALARHAGVPLSRQRLIDYSHGEGAGVEERVVDQRVYRLRRALEAGGCDHQINTARGHGYYLARVM